jgi:antitoxin component YwqK of YwqJK toxin-antitoxin module
MSLKKIYYENFVLESEVLIINDNMEGLYKSYYKTDNKSDIRPNLFCNYVNGIKHGEEIEYYDNQSPGDYQIARICSYINGKLNGESKQYHYDGKLENLEYYEEDCRQGECKYYNQNGFLNEVINYINDSMDGKYYKYQDGILETECEYYYSQSEFDEYMGELLVGDYINYYSNGQIKDKCCYEDGKKNGEYIKYHENGKIKAKGNYENNYLVGYEYRYDIDGNLIEKVFVDENEDDYNENGE